MWCPSYTPYTKSSWKKNHSSVIHFFRQQRQEQKSKDNAPVKGKPHGSQSKRGGGQTGLTPLVRHLSTGSSCRSGSISVSGPGPALATTALPLPTCFWCGFTFMLSCCFTAPWRGRAVVAAAEMAEDAKLLLIISPVNTLCSLFSTTLACFCCTCTSLQTDTNKWIMVWT